MNTFWRFFCFPILLACTPAQAPKAPASGESASSSSHDDDAAHRVAGAETNIKRCASFVLLRHVPHCVVELTDEQRSARNFNVKLTYDSEGRVRETAYVDAQGAPVEDSEGIAKNTYFYHGTKLVEERGYDLCGTQRFRVDVRDESFRRMSDPWGHKHQPLEDEVVGTLTKFDEVGHVIEYTYVDDGGQPTADEDGIVSVRQKWSEDHMLQRRRYFGVDGQPSRNSDGIHDIRYEKDAWGNTVRQSFFDELGRPAHDGYGRHRTTSRYDSAGMWVGSKYFRIDGSPGVYEQGVHEMRVTRNSQGETVRRELFDASGKPKIGEWDYQTMTTEYDGHHRSIRYSYFGSYGEPVEVWNDQAVTVLEYERDLEARRIYLDKNGEKVRFAFEPTVTEYEYDEACNLTAERYFDATGAPDDRHRRGHLLRNVYDEHHRLVEVRYEFADGSPARTFSSVHKKLYSYDEAGNLDTIQYLDDQANTLELYRYALIEIPFQATPVETIPASAHKHLHHVRPGSVRSRKDAEVRAARAVEELKQGRPARAVANRFSDPVGPADSTELGVLLEPRASIARPILERIRALDIGEVAAPFEDQGSVWVLQLIDSFGPRVRAGQEQPEDPSLPWLPGQ